MSTILEPESTHDSTTTAASERVRTSFAACRLTFSWLGTTKSLSSEQKSQAAETFGAAKESISAGKKLFDTKHESYKALTSLKSQITRFWKDNSLAYPESGIRLIRQNRIDEFAHTFADFQSQLEAGVRRLDEHFCELKEAARIRLGSLYDSTDYPSTLADEFSVSYDFPSVEAPDYLRRLNPELYAQQSRRISERFDRAVEMAEQAFIEQLDGLVNHLAERLSGNDDGKPKIFRDSAVQNFREFFIRFKELSVSSNEQLDDLVQRCELLMDGVQPQQLRNNDSLRRSLATNLSTVQSSLDQLLVDRPRRNILRPNRRQED